MEAGTRPNASRVKWFLAYAGVYLHLLNFIESNIM